MQSTRVHARIIQHPFASLMQGARLDSFYDAEGEGAEGMTIAEIREEAQWVIERLEQNRSVLVHCVAGMNRSATVCCAVLMLLEGLTAGAALERVRQHHPWARPDSHHWLALRWLEMNNKEN